MSKSKVYKIETCVWNNEEEDYEEEKEIEGLTGVQAMKKVAEFLNEFPEAKDSTVITEPGFEPIIAMAYTEENGNEHWIEVYLEERGEALELREWQLDVMSNGIHLD